jgi:zinc protease
VAEVAIVGDFDDAKALATLKELLEGWKSPKPYQRIDQEYRDVPPATLTVATPDKENATLPRAHEREPARRRSRLHPLYCANYILGGGAGLDSRLAQRIRQKDGPVVRRRLRPLGELDRPRGLVHGLRDRRAAERGEGGGRASARS